MFNRDEKGQSVILIAVSIVLILTVALTIYNIQMLLVAKQKVRQMTDATAFAGALSRKNGLISFQQIDNLDLLVALSWELGTAYQHILSGAQYVHEVVPGYDATADLLATDSSIQNFVPIHNHISDIHDGGLVEDSTYAMAQQFFILESLLYAKAVEERNLSITSFPSENHLSLLIPAEMITNQGSVLSCEEDDYSSYRWHIGKKNGRMVFQIEKLPDALQTSIGFACIEIINTPQTIFSSFLSSFNPTKSGKLVAFAYAYPYNMEDSESEFEAADLLVNDMEQIHSDNSDLVEIMEEIAEMKKPKTKDKTALKNAWNTLVANCNDLLAIYQESGLMDVLDIGSDKYQANPVMGSLHTLNLLSFPSYQAVADTKGIDYTTQTGKNTFYNTFTLADIFGSKEDLWQDLQTTYQTLIDNQSEFGDEVDHLLNSCKFFDINHANGNNIPYFFEEVPQIVEDNIENTTLQDFLTLSSLVSEDIVDCYQSLSDLPAILSNTPSVTVESFMPSIELLNYLSSLFSTPIVRWEGS